MNYNRVFVRGDTHGYFDWLPDWCEENHTTKDDALIILGDASILYYGPTKNKEHMIKEFIAIYILNLIYGNSHFESKYKPFLYVGEILSLLD